MALPALIPLLSTGIGIVGGAVSIAQGVSALNSQAADKKTINRRNEAVRIANVQVSEINKDIRAATRGITNAFERGVNRQNAIIESSNAEVRDLNTQAVQAIEGANQEIQTVNTLNREKAVNENRSEQLRVAREIRQSVRERMIRESQTRASAAISGVEGSGLEGGVSSLSSQTGEIIGNATQQSAITQENFGLDFAASLAQGRALGLQNKAELAQIAAVQTQREAEASLRVAQNRMNLQTTRIQNRISLLQNRADRIRENANAAPGAFIRASKNQERKELRQKWKANGVDNDAIRRRLERRGLTSPQINSGSSTAPARTPVASRPTVLTGGGGN